MESITLKDEFIKLGQAMKLANLVEDGVEAKLGIQDGLVTVNGLSLIPIFRCRRLHICRYRCSPYH